MAKYIINGDALVIVSEKKLQDLKTLAKYAPKALSLFREDKEFGEVEDFSVMVAPTGKGGMNINGAIFTGEARDGSGAACITILLPDGIADAKEYVAETYGPAMVKLDLVESQIDEALAKVAADKAAVLAKITVA